MLNRRVMRASYIVATALRSLMEAKRTTFAHFETYRFW
jgi:hypothetical protein